MVPLGRIASGITAGLGNQLRKAYAAQLHRAAGSLTALRLPASINIPRPPCWWPG